MSKKIRMKNGTAHIPRILFAAGGTGGHIYPALAVQKALSGMNGRIECRFACGARPLEYDLYIRSGVTPVVLNIPSRKTGFMGRFTDMFRLSLGFMQAFFFLLKWKPDWILAQGGYVTAPVLAAARILRIPYDVQEQNAIPGKTNRWFAPGAHTIYCSFQDAASRFMRLDPDFRCLYTGMPLRPESLVRKETDKILSRKSLGLEPELPLLLVLGGSQGAANLYRHLSDALREIDGKPSSCPDFQCLWSSGAQNFDWIQKELESRSLHRIRVRVQPYFDDMGRAFSAADAAVSRSGASSVAELMANRIPTIFVPLPNSKDNHQWFNARVAVDAGAAIHIEEDGNAGQSLVRGITELMASGERRAQMSEFARGLMPQDAAETIARDLLKKVKNSC
ncbi:UDP-N-acetylglucosamine--N-acetylmuramyl-(pentapeptide) pyrophosphoryl-undecaprenol N-acetylglucosamine transferase [Candidatus Sumerlaeota bacterium]|nr:UDP-N-acetylglucosamine--N-acetylmuramyl-(pentapeptide) pyrophosphoryl-undecaprenol N-acetylglucosamine transferase [Candidatus Sumerlaeota bacterium]